MNFLIFFHKLFSLAISYRVIFKIKDSISFFSKQNAQKYLQSIRISICIKNLIKRAQVTLKTRFRVPVFSIFGIFKAVRFGQ